MGAPRLTTFSAFDDLEQNDGYVSRKEECKVPMLVSSAPNQVHLKVF